ncbi:hypothetical protein ACMHYB_29405 [Sorangium sp. So ce1128]
MDVYHGRYGGAGALGGEASVALRCVGELGGGRYRYEGVIPARECGEHAFGVRVTPHHDLLGGRFATRLLAWH